ncbi:unnamed protein product [Strongylus vulgaris]|uniref:Uncharacterized protein n=1 Tax=Strongylus vulgaris TaxID=40348 RepID=A0A3P7K110_STRVU|nr:unnamed protein product [Strongylus vulgaris]
MAVYASFPYFLISGWYIGPKDSVWLMKKWRKRRKKMGLFGNWSR